MMVVMDVETKLKHVFMLCLSVTLSKMVGIYLGLG